MSGVDPKTINKTVAHKLLTVVNEKGGAAHAAQLRENLTEWTAAQASDIHRQRMAELADDPLGLCAYLGELGWARENVARFVGADLDSEMREAYADGVASRVLEARALQLARARAGDRIEAWMLKEQ